MIRHSGNRIVTENLASSDNTLIDRHFVLGSLRCFMICLYIFTERQLLQMKDKSNKYLILGIVFLSIGITMLMTKAVSSPIAYAGLALAFTFFEMSMRKDDSDKEE